MTRLSKIAIFAGLLCFLLASLAVSAAPTKPTTDQKKEMQEAMKRGESYKKRYEECRKKEQEWRDKDNEELADAWARAAEAWQGAINANRELIITLVDIYYNIEAPPNTTIKYNPNSKYYGETGGDKDDIEVELCPRTFKNGPGLVASTKIHELRHAWQIYWCFSDLPGYWDDCTFWGHVTEWDSYNEEEKAYDSCITSDMDEKEKKVIKKALEKHRKGALKALLIGWLVSPWFAFAGDMVSFPFVIYNASDHEDLIQVTVSDELGWEIFPTATPIVLLPEEEAFVEVMIQVPPDALPGTVNSITVEASPSTIPVAENPRDVSNIIVSPIVKVTPGDEVSAARGESPAVQFSVENIGPHDDIFDIVLTNPEGWTTVPSSFPGVALPSGNMFPVDANVTVPPAAPDWTTNLILCTATSQTSPTHTHTAWLPLVVKEADVGPLVIEAPLGSLALNDNVAPRTWVLNTGHVDATFDTFFEIRRLDSSLFYSNSTNVAALAPDVSQEVSFSTVALDEPGTFTAKAYTVLTGDADASNDSYSDTFIVVWASPTPTPEPAPIKRYTFEADPEGWTFRTPSPTEVHVSHWDNATSVVGSSIGISSPFDETTNYFALWDSFDTDWISYSGDSLYQVDWAFSTSRATTNAVPSLRFRIGLANQKAFAYSRAYPGDWVPLAQTPGTTTYTLFFEPPIAADGLFLAFSTIDWTDDFRLSQPAGEVYLEEVSVYRHDLSAFTSWQAEAISDSFDSWTSGGAPPYTFPTYTRTTDTLSLASGVNADRVFGLWDSPAALFTLGASKLYRLKSNVSANPQLGGPDLRLRVNTDDFRYAWYSYYVSSFTAGESALPAETGEDFHLYMMLPDTASRSCRYSMDLIDFSNAFGGTLSLHDLSLDSHPF